MRRGLSFCAVVVFLGLADTSGGSVAARGMPSLEAILEVPQVSRPRLSPLGDTVLFTLSRPDWQANRYDTEIYVAGIGRPPRQITQGPAGSSREARWAPDGQSFAYLGGEQGPQIYLASMAGGPPRRLTSLPTGILTFEWSPDGRHIAFASIDGPAVAEGKSPARGNFRVLRANMPRASLWLLDVEAAKGNAPQAVRRLTGEGESRAMSIVTFSVNDLTPNFAFSPDGRQIAFTHARSLNIMDAVQADLSILDIESGRLRHFGATPDYWDESPSFSPDGRQIVFSRLRMTDFLADNELVLMPLDGEAPRILKVRDARTKAALGQTVLLGWRGGSIYALSQHGVEQHLQRIQPDSGLARRVRPTPEAMLDADVSPAGNAAAYLAVEQGGVPEIYLKTSREKRARRLSGVMQSLDGWPAHKVELVSWRAPDGISVEGVLYIPAGVKRSAPLVVVIHGGPRDVSRPTRMPVEFFPIEHWLAQGIVVLSPNYRGSTGYGEHFRRLTLTNTGHAEALDINSGVDALVRSGLIDQQRVAVAGHSWGGYIAAFLATTSQRYRAAIVASGITDNTINYVLSNAGVAELGYLQSSPWRSRERWLATSPIGHVGDARTPTLILHGENDPVIPVANAYLLDRALADLGVPVRTVIFGEAGHSGFSPRERRTALQESIDWIDKYVLDAPARPAAGQAQ